MAMGGEDFRFFTPLRCVQNDRGRGAAFRMTSNQNCQQNLVHAVTENILIVLLRIASAHCGEGNSESELGASYPSLRLARNSIGPVAS